MITFHKGDILEFVGGLTVDQKSPRVFLVQCVNDANLMGSGIAKTIYERYPIVKEMYHYYDQHYGLTLGSFHAVYIKHN